MEAAESERELQTDSGEGVTARWKDRATKKTGQYVVGETSKASSQLTDQGFLPGMRDAQGLKLQTGRGMRMHANSAHIWPTARTGSCMPLKISAWIEGSPC
jgi:hypothetical protein